MAVLNPRPAGGAAWGLLPQACRLAATSCGHRIDVNASLYHLPRPYYHISILPV
uniref:Uncharacterized protein n=1 Tax=Hyaloperonospora arabidopsidis (strain Emoy2) TaxID=559515 RepID=M4BRS4_HYAAE